MSNQILVDPEHFHLLGDRWIVDAHGYARKNTIANGVRSFELLHRVILNAPQGALVDHINGNRLDNRVSNLRFCTHQQNMQNRKTHKNNKIGAKGVYKIGNRFKAQIRAGGEKHYLGCFVRLEDARAAYQEAAMKHHGEFARIA